MRFFGKEFTDVQHGELEFALNTTSGGKGRPREPFYTVEAGSTWPTAEEVRTEAGKIKGLAELLKSKGVGKVHQGGRLADVPLTIMMSGEKWEYLLEDVLIEGVADDPASTGLNFAREALGFVRSTEDRYAQQRKEDQERSDKVHKEEVDRLNTIHAAELARLQTWYEAGLKQMHSLFTQVVQSYEASIKSAFDSTRVSGDSARDKILIDLHEALKEELKKGGNGQGMIDVADKIMGMVGKFGTFSEGLKTIASASAPAPLLTVAPK